MSTSDVRYNVLKERSSEVDSTWETFNLNNAHFNLNNKVSSSSNQTNSTTPTIKAKHQLYNNNSNNNIAILKQSKSIDEYELDNTLSTRLDEDNYSMMNNLPDKSYVEIIVKAENSKLNLAESSNNLPLSSSTMKTSSNMDNLNELNLPQIEYSLKNKILNKKFTILEKVLILCVVFLMLIVFLFYVNSSFKKLPSSEGNEINESKTICLTDKCLLVASSIYKSINEKVDPCDDFYEYACGGWIKKNLIPTGFPRWGTLSLITYENQLIIKDQLESNLTYPDITEAEMKAKKFYMSCIDTKETIEKLGAKPLLNILEKYVYIDSQSRLIINASFSELVSVIQIEYGLNGLFEINVLDDDKNSSFSNLEIIQGSLGLDRSYYINNSSEKNANTLEVYKKTIVNVLKMLYGNIKDVNEEMERLIEFETALAKIMIPTQNLSNVESVYSRARLYDLNHNYATFLNWTTFLNKFLKDYNSPEVLSPNDEIIVIGLSYFQDLSKILDEYRSDAEKEKTLKLTLLFHLIKFSLPLLSKEYRNQYSAIGEALTGANSVERWQTCIERTDNIFGLGFAISRMFVRKAPNNTKNAAQTIIRSIKDSFIKNFQHITWMDDQTRKLAEEKVNFVDDLIGYPDFIQDDNALNERYLELNITEDEYFENEIRLIQFSLKSEVITYRTRVNRSEWEMTSSAVNAYYSPTRNQIVFPSGILQDPFFHPENPMSINYGSIGSVMGHELTHGFDDSGREYDKHGMMHQWWNNKTIEDFKHASECIADQYSKFKIGSDFLNGRQTLGENIADNGGLRAAYNAYENWVQNNGEEKTLPLLNLSNKQLFFVSFAQTWCSKSTEDSLHLSLSVDQHSPPRFRVIGSVSNSEEFSKAFKCPLNSKMNPHTKCNLW